MTSCHDRAVHLLKGSRSDGDLSKKWVIQYHWQPDDEAQEIAVRVIIQKCTLNDIVLKNRRPTR